MKKKCAKRMALTLVVVVVVSSAHHPLLVASRVAVLRFLFCEREKENERILSVFGDDAFAAAVSVGTVRKLLSLCEE